MQSQALTIQQCTNQRVPTSPIQETKHKKKRQSTSQYYIQQQTNLPQQPSNKHALIKYHIACHLFSSLYFYFVYGCMHKGLHWSQFHVSRYLGIPTGNPPMWWWFCCWFCLRLSLSAISLHSLVHGGILMNTCYINLLSQGLLVFVYACVCVSVRMRIFV